MPDPIDATEYEPLYVTLSDVPLEVEDTYSESQKREALFQAESDFELDYNGGYQVPHEEMETPHVKAVLNAATYYLVRSATGPKDVTLGELQDGGDQKDNHADQYIKTYKLQIKRIAEAGGEGKPGTYYGSSGNRDGPFVVNSRSEHTESRRKRRNRNVRRNQRSRYGR